MLDLKIDDATGDIDITAGFSMQLPTSGDFYNVDLNQDLQSELEIIEKS